MTRTLSNPTPQSGSPSDWWGMPRLSTRKKHNKSHRRLFRYNFIVPYAHAAACYLTFWHAVYFVCVVLCLFIPSLTRMHFYYCAMICSFKQSNKHPMAPLPPAPRILPTRSQGRLTLRRASDTSSIMYAERASQLLGNNNS